MINTISNFNLALFDTLPNAGQDPAASETEKGDFASLLLGIPVTSVPVNTAGPAGAASIAGVTGEAGVKADEAPATDFVIPVVRATETPVAELPPQEDVCWGAMGCEPSIKDTGIEALNRGRFIVNFDTPTKPLENAPAGTGGIKNIPTRPIIANKDTPTKPLPTDPASTVKEFPLEALNRRRPVTEAGPGASIPTTNTGTPADPAWQTDISKPVLPTRLQPQESLWANETPRDPKTKKDFGLAILTDGRQITNYPAQNGGTADPASATPTGTSIMEKALSTASQDVVITNVEVSSPLPAFETGPPVAPEVRLQSDGEAVADILAAESKVAVANDTRETVKPREFQPTIRPGVLPLRSQKPLERNPFETAETPETAETTQTVGSVSVGVTENLTGLGQLRREVSFAYQPVPEGGPRTLPSNTVRNVASAIYGQTPFELTETRDSETIQAEIPVQAHDGADIFNTVLDKFKNIDAPAVSEVKTETVAELLKQAKETVDQLKPGLIELAALTARKNEKQSMRMRLHPAELGTVDISLERNSNGRLNAHFNTANDNAREVLTQNLDQLRESLQNAGFQIGQLQVSSGSTPFSSANGQSDRGPQSESFQGHMSGSNTEQSDETEQDASRLLNLRA